MDDAATTLEENHPAAAKYIRTVTGGGMRYAGPGSAPAKPGITIDEHDILYVDGELTVIRGRVGGLVRAAVRARGADVKPETLLDEITEPGQPPATDQQLADALTNLK